MSLRLPGSARRWALPASASRTPAHQQPALLWRSAHFARVRWHNNRFIRISNSSPQLRRRHCQRSATAASALASASSTSPSVSAAAHSTQQPRLSVAFAAPKPCIRCVAPLLAALAFSSMQQQLASSSAAAAVPARARRQQPQLQQPPPPTGQLCARASRREHSVSRINIAST